MPYDLRSTRRRIGRNSRRTSSWLLLHRNRGSPLVMATRTVPIVFESVVIDPVGAGFVTSLVRPGGNATGFLMFEYGLSGKWLELLKQISAGRDASSAVVFTINYPSVAFFRYRASSPPSRPLRRPWGWTSFRSTRAICIFARNRACRHDKYRALRLNGGLIVTGEPSA